MVGRQNINRALQQHLLCLSCERSTSFSPRAQGSSLDGPDKGATGRARVQHYTGRPFSSHWGVVTLWEPHVPSTQGKEG